MSSDQIVRRPLRVRERSSRPLDQRLVLRFPRDFEYYPPREFVEVGFVEPCYRGEEGFRKMMRLGPTFLVAISL